MCMVEEQLMCNMVDARPPACNRQDPYRVVINDAKRPVTATLNSFVSHNHALHTGADAVSMYAIWQELKLWQLALEQQQWRARLNIEADDRRSICV